MNEQISRRDFLKGIAILAGGVFLAPSELYAGNKNVNTQRPQQPDSRTNTQRTYHLEDCVDAIIEIESEGNPRATRYEKRLGQWSYGLGQFLIGTAQDVEKKHQELPRLGNTQKEIIESLFNPKINRAYIEAHFQDQYQRYNDSSLAVAAYNAGDFAPRNAWCQQQLCDLYKVRLTLNGLFDKRNSRARDVVKKFQREHKLKADGILGTKTYAALQQAWCTKFPGKYDAFAIIPQNGSTPNHVEKFRTALSEIVQRKEKEAKA